jgi:hypothetical protein
VATRGGGARKHAALHQKARISLRFTAVIIAHMFRMSGSTEIYNN